MNELPELSASPTNEELIAWFDMAEKINNELWAKAIARDKAKKKTRITEPYETLLFKDKPECHN